MIRQVFIGLYTEGTTDERFLQSLVLKVFNEIAFEAHGDFDFFIKIIKIDRQGLSYVDQVLNASRDGIDKYGISFLCVHKDADDQSDERVFSTAIRPAISELNRQNDDYCKAVVAIVPIRMTEAWLLADKILFKQHLGTELSDEDLGFTNNPENIANPKQTISNAIRIAMSNRPKRRRQQLTISELYMPLGDQIDTIHLEKLSSYRKFKESVRDAFVSLNYLQL